MSAPCIRCGAGGLRVSCEKDGAEVAAGYMCETCLDAAWNEFRDLHSQFDELIAAGVSRKAANKIMIERISGTGGDG